MVTVPQELQAPRSRRHSRWRSRWRGPGGTALLLLAVVLLGLYDLMRGPGPWLLWTLQGRPSLAKEALHRPAVGSTAFAALMAAPVGKPPNPVHLSGLGLGTAQAATLADRYGKDPVWVGEAFALASMSFNQPLAEALATPRYAGWLRQNAASLLAQGQVLGVQGEPLSVVQARTLASGQTVIITPVGGTPIRRQGVTTVQVVAAFRESLPSGSWPLVLSVFQLDLRPVSPGQWRVIGWQTVKERALKGPWTGP